MGKKPLGEAACLARRLARFWGAGKRTEQGCLVWQQRSLKSGYAATTFGGTRYRIHRLAWKLSNGNIPDGMWVLHRCDIPLCYEPSHLFLGTHADNESDKDAKGRRPRGETHWNYKLSDVDFEEIRSGNGLQTVAAERYGISSSYVSMIRSGRHSRSQVLA